MCFNVVLDDNGALCLRAISKIRHLKDICKNFGFGLFVKFVDGKKKNRISLESLYKMYMHQFKHISLSLFVYILIIQILKDSGTEYLNNAV